MKKNKVECDYFIRFIYQPKKDAQDQKYVMVRENGYLIKKRV